MVVDRQCDDELNSWPVVTIEVTAVMICDYERSELP